MLFDWTTPLSAANGRETRFTRWLAAGWTHPGMPVAVGLLHYPNGLGSLQTLYFRLLTAACLLVLILRFRLLRLRQEPAPTRI